MRVNDAVRVTCAGSGVHPEAILNDGRLNVLAPEYMYMDAVRHIHKVAFHLGRMGTTGPSHRLSLGAGETRSLLRALTCAVQHHVSGVLAEDQPGPTEDVQG